MKLIDSILGRPQQRPNWTPPPQTPGVVLVTLAYQVNVDEIVFDDKMCQALATLNAAVARQVMRSK